MRTPRLIERRDFQQYDKAAGLAALGMYGRRGDASRSLRHRLAEAQNWHCCYCGVEMNRWRNVPTVCTLEHVIPETAGGLACWETCVAACKKCNTADGVRIFSEGQALVTAPLCANCGGDNLRQLPRNICRCLDCHVQFRLGTASGMPFGVLRFFVLRRVAGEMIVGTPDPARIARVLRYRMLTDLNFIPYRLTDALMNLAREPIEIARSMSDDLVEIYDDVIAVLRDSYTPETVKPPRGGFPEIVAGVRASLIHLSSSNSNRPTRSAPDGRTIFGKSETRQQGNSR
jgi:hypothetical protein